MLFDSSSLPCRIMRELKENGGVLFVLKTGEVALLLFMHKLVRRMEAVLETGTSYAIEIAVELE